ncbi:hypothetical protein AVEN_69795-1 [Araneus ventricosus]|uniref:Uncharacterized protein n=1 Tax=Araneus ventricosus TaxID=182803 RepID=A0A4Y2UE52_ARAVE|nr:hypothetical protein AVEN_69795-1 [Araneus ventricosus]
MLAVGEGQDGASVQQGLCPSSVHVTPGDRYLFHGLIGAIVLFMNCSRIMEKTPYLLQDPSPMEEAMTSRWSRNALIYKLSGHKEEADAVPALGNAGPYENNICAHEKKMKIFQHEC